MAASRLSSWLPAPGPLTPYLWAPLGAHSSLQLQSSQQPRGAVACQQHCPPGQRLSTQAWCPSEEEAAKQDCFRYAAREKMPRKVELLLSRGTVRPSLGSSRSRSHCKPHLDFWENSPKHQVPPNNPPK